LADDPAAAEAASQVPSQSPSASPDARAAAATHSPQVHSLAGQQAEVNAAAMAEGQPVAVTMAPPSQARQQRLRRRKESPRAWISLTATLPVGLGASGRRPPARASLGRQEEESQESIAFFVEA
jgi:hypothetical protein